MTATIKRIHPALPIFRLERDGRCVFYTPGHLTVLTEADATMLEAALGDRGPGRSRIEAVAAQIRRCAEQARAAWHRLVDQPFAPECLTLYLSNRCNLACAYCYAADPPAQSSRRAGRPVLAERPVLAATRLVAWHCARKHKPLRVVLHGGGEPTLEWPLVQRLVQITRHVANEAGVPWWGYIATNGVLSPQRAAWLSKHFNQIALSCDGPEDIQNRQRSFPGGSSTTKAVERTAAILADNGASLTVRATITRYSLDRQVEIVNYLHRSLGATEIRFEPVYRAPVPEQRFGPDDAPRFIDHFLAAQKRARELGCRLSISCVRLEEVHGPYCDVLRGVLRLTPDGRATTCFLCISGRNTDHKYTVGYYDERSANFVLDETRIVHHRRRATRIPDRCHDCVNVFHCTRECPEACLLDSVADNAPGFRCLLAKGLATAWILQAAESASVPTQSSADRARRDEDRRFSSLMGNLPQSVDVAAIVRQWQAARHYLDGSARPLPVPLWAKRGFEHDGVHAWEQLRRYVPTRPASQAISIYVHIPFCDRRCAFCDCYSLPLGRDGAARQEELTRSLLDEIDCWAGIEALNCRSVTTVHFGGGTPAVLGVDRFASVLARLRTAFAVSDRTEWALESTSSLLTNEHLDQLRQCGFSRLHVGVQTLDNSIRRVIGRRQPADKVVERLAAALAKGFVTSVDIIYGLPGQSASGLVSTLDRLIRLGVHGFSVYQLQVSMRNRRFLAKHGALKRDWMRDYVLFQIAEQYLRSHGYRKNHFVHFAIPPDANLYYTNALRGEDQLALGPTADGVFGDYLYRHGQYENYVSASGSRLEGGLWLPEPARRLRAATASLMAGRITGDLLRRLGAEKLLQAWLSRALLERDEEDQHTFVLTGNGSWLLTKMLAELETHTFSHQKG